MVARDALAADTGHVPHGPAVHASRNERPRSALAGRLPFLPLAPAEVDELYAVSALDLRAVLVLVVVGVGSPVRADALRPAVGGAGDLDVVRSSRTLIASAVPPSCARSRPPPGSGRSCWSCRRRDSRAGLDTAGWRLTWRVNLILTRSGSPRPCRWAIRARGRVHESPCSFARFSNGACSVCPCSLQRPIAAAVRALPVAARDSTDPAAASPCVAAGEEAVTCVATTSAVRATTSSGTRRWAAGTAGDVSSGAGAQSRFGPSTCPRPHRGVPLCRRKAGAVRSNFLGYSR